MDDNDVRGAALALMQKPPKTRKNDSPVWGAPINGGDTHPTLLDDLLAVKASIKGSEHSITEILSQPHTGMIVAPVPEVLAAQHQGRAANDGKAAVKAA